MKKSVRYIKKKFKAEKMRKQIQVLEVMPGFMASAKTFFDVVDLLGIDTNVLCSSFGVGVDNKMVFKQSFEKLEKLFPPAYRTLFDSSMICQILSSIHVEEPEIGFGRGW